jgi:uncharacterized protein (TIGR03437 family)
MNRLAVLLLWTAAGFGASRLPVAFEPNRGQAAPGTDFTARGPGFRISLRSGGADIAAGHSPVTTVLTGAHSAVRPEAEAPLPGVANYYRLDDPSHAISGIPTYARVRYRGIYPGIDIVYYGDQERLEYDFILAPGADPRRIRIRYQGARALHVDAQGDLVLETAGGTLRQHRPVLYQEIAGVRREVSGHYVLRGRTAGFEVAAYDRSRPLVIDPVLTWASYFGPTRTNTADAVAVDATGNIYLAGSTISSNGYLDAFISKLNASGTATIYTMTVGDTYDDIGHAIAVDIAGNAYVVGETNTPTAFGTFSPTTFISKLDSTGKIVFAFSWGGSGDDNAYGVAVDSSNNVYMAGLTNSPDFPVSRGSQQVSLRGGYDGFVTKFDANGNGLASTFLGGSGDDFIYAIVVDSSGTLYVTGSTGSADFPVTLAAYQPRIAGATDAFISKLSPSLTLNYSTYLGGTDKDGADSIAVDSSGAVYIAGQTSSTNFPMVNPLQKAFGGASDIFIAKLSGDGATLGYSTYLGGTKDEIAYAVAVDGAGNAYITGATTSTDFPVSDAFQQTNQGQTNGLVAGISASGSTLLFSSYLGGSGSADAGGDYGNALAASCAAGVVVVGTTASNNFPATTGAVRTAYGGGSSDGFIASIGVLGMPAIAAGGVVNAATSSNAPVAPGSLITIYGSFLALSTQQASTLPLPTTLGGGASVTINGTPAPIVYAGAGQINLQVPYGAGPGSATAVVSTPCGASASATFQVAPAAPYVFSIGNNVAAARNQDNSINGPGNPAKAGSVITVYLTGIGPLDNPVDTGGAPTVLSQATLPKSASIGGANAVFQFLGLAPGFVGLAQANLFVPALSGGPYPVVITVGGVDSNGPTIYVQ